MNVSCSQAGQILGPGQSCQFTLIVAPIAEGNLSVTFELFDNTLNNNTTPGYEQITLTGTSMP